MKKIPLLRAVIFGVFLAVAAAPSYAAEKEVSFKTRDGWTIYGTFSTPDRVNGKVPAVIFLHSFNHDRDAYGQQFYPGLAQIIGRREVATLIIDLRGRGKSMGERELHSFSSDELSKIYLDVRAAIAFLASEPSVDTSRLGIVAETTSAEAAVMGWGGDSRVRAIVLLSGRLGGAAKRQIAANPRTPLLVIVSKEDREGFRDMAAVYKLAQNKQSRIIVYKDLGIGTAMFNLRRAEYPHETPIEDDIAEWIARQL